jgi:bifunctional UDP-N-acetylglucosamine pyrophosphorylase/glucosamine-1-phosphate N-acetyltransferase
MSNKKIVLCLLLSATQSTIASIQAVVFAAGKSSRFEGETSKLLTPCNGKEMILYPTQALAELHIPQIIIVGHQKELVCNTVQKALPNAEINFITQEEQLGTGHALKCAQSALTGDDILMLYGDQPLITSKTLQQLIDAHHEKEAVITIMVSLRTESGSYGRIVTDNGITKCVEAKDFGNTDPRKHPRVNAGYYLIKRDFIDAHIDELKVHSNKNEIYINDFIEIASTLGYPINMVFVPYECVHGVNTIEELAFAEQTMLMQKNPTLNQSIQAVVFAAGKSSRFEGELPKLLMPIGGKAMVSYPVNAAADLDIPVTVVVGFENQLVMKAVSQYVPNGHITFALQEEQLGTGHALQTTKDFWYADNILVMNGDHPLTSAPLLQKFINAHLTSKADMSILTAEADASCNYGRIVQENGMTHIVEAVDFQKNPHDYPLVNAGFYLIKRSFLEKNIDALWLHTNKNEYYITDLIEIAQKQGIAVNLVPVALKDVYGVNTVAEFALAEKLLASSEQPIC